MPKLVPPPSTLRQKLSLLPFVAAQKECISKTYTRNATVKLQANMCRANAAVTGIKAFIKARPFSNDIFYFRFSTKNEFIRTVQVAPLFVVFPILIICGPENREKTVNNT